MDKTNFTESDSSYDHLERMSVIELLQNINKEDKTVAESVERALPQVEVLVENIVPRMLDGGRLFYIGAGTSGRLGIVDASECPPTFGVTDDVIIGLIAGGDGAIRKAVEFAEDDEEQGWKDILNFKPTIKDTVIGIAASGRTPYVIGAMKSSKNNGLLTGCITCNKDSRLSAVTELPVEVLVGPEFISGSTRMKAGTAQKMVLNMISTSIMIKLGRVKGNKMVDMQLSNKKLIERGIRMIMEKSNVSRIYAQKMLKEHGSVRKVLKTLLDD